MFAVFGVGVGRMTDWRGAQVEAGRQKRGRMWQPVQVLGLDGAYVRAWGGIRPVMVAVDWGEGQPVAIGDADKYNPI